MLDALARAKVVSLSEDAFEKEGQTIRFRRIKLGPAGPPAARRLVRARGRRRRDGLSRQAVVKVRKRAEPKGRARRRARAARGRQAAGAAQGVAARPEQGAGVPAFVVLTDRTLNAIAARRPASLEISSGSEGYRQAVRGQVRGAVLRLVRRVEAQWRQASAPPGSRPRPALALEQKPRIRGARARTASPVMRCRRCRGSRRRSRSARVAQGQSAQPSSGQWLRCGLRRGSRSVALVLHAHVQRLHIASS
jgi:hypothetical protein